MQRRVQTDGSVIRRQLIDQGLPFRFTPLAGNRDFQLVLINRDRQGLQRRHRAGVEVRRALRLEERPAHGEPLAVLAQRRALLLLLPSWFPIRLLTSRFQLPTIFIENSR